MNITSQIIFVFSISLLYCQGAFAQCEIFSTEENPNGEYSVKVALQPTAVVPSALDCPEGYTWNIRIAYNIVFEGETPPDSLLTLQGNLYCDSMATFFQLPNAGGMGDTITVGDLFREQMDCDSITLDSLHCDSIVLEIEGPGIPLTLINCPIEEGSCPSQGMITSNKFCIEVSYDSIVPPLFDSIIFEESVYYYEEGVGTIEDPAIYKSGGGGGACNASIQAFEGDLVINGDTCTYIGGFLPVTFVSLSATLDGEDVLLSWTVAHEEDISHYVVQLLLDNQWLSLNDVLPGKEGSAVKQYSHKATGLPRQDRYVFRIASMDHDGTMTYSELVQIGRNLVGQPVLAPNPISGGEFSILGINLDEFIVEIINPVTAQRWRADPDGTSVDVFDLPATTYVVQLVHRLSGDTFVRKLVKI